MTTTSVLTWLTNGIQHYTLKNDQGRRFVISREPTPLPQLWMLEQRQYYSRNKSKVTVLRQLRSIKTLEEAMRIAEQDWA